MVYSIRQRNPKNKIENKIKGLKDTENAEKAMCLVPK